MITKWLQNRRQRAQEQEAQKQREQQEYEEKLSKDLDRYSIVLKETIRKAGMVPVGWDCTSRDGEYGVHYAIQNGRLVKLIVTRKGGLSINYVREE